MHLVCTAGWYGQKCDKKCGHCAMTWPNCQFTTGACQECEGGWTGDNCDKSELSSTIPPTPKPTTPVPGRPTYISCTYLDNIFLENCILQIMYTLNTRNYMT